jgi:hypothetical protein
MTRVAEAVCRSASLVSWSLSGERAAVENVRRARPDGIVPDAYSLGNGEPVQRVALL